MLRTSGYVTYLLIYQHDVLKYRRLKSPVLPLSESNEILGIVMCPISFSRVMPFPAQKHPFA